MIEVLTKPKEVYYQNSSTLVRQDILIKLDKPTNSFMFKRYVLLFYGSNLTLLARCPSCWLPASSSYHFPFDDELWMFLFMPPSMRLPHIMVACVGATSAGSLCGDCTHASRSLRGCKRRLRTHRGLRFYLEAGFPAVQSSPRRGKFLRWSCACARAGAAPLFSLHPCPPPSSRTSSASSRWCPPCQ